MSAAGWYLRVVDRKRFSRWAREAGAGEYNPAVLICSCGATFTFEVLAAIGGTCERCREPLLTAEQLSAAWAAIGLGGDYRAALTMLLGIPCVDDDDAAGI